jgi:hypothetical protein
MLALYNSERFQREYANYRSRIDEISTPSTRQRAETLLANLVGEVKFLDKQHEEILISNRLPVRLNESTSKIQDIRKDLERLLKDSKSSNV